MKTISRLMKLPAVFTLQDLLRLGLKRQTAHTTTMRWADNDLIVQAGPRAGVYFNLVADRQAHINRRLEAARRMYPSAIVVGPAVLHAHGWTTQVPHTIDVAILKSPSTRSVRQIHGVHFVTRSIAWYRQHFGDLLRAGQTSPFEIDSLSPGAALQDARTSGDLWVPDEDDLEVPEDALAPRAEQST